jgi:hypothetical protein
MIRLSVHFYNEEIECTASYYGFRTPVGPGRGYRTNIHQLVHYLNMHRHDKEILPMHVKVGLEGRALITGSICWHYGLR